MDSTSSTAFSLIYGKVPPQAKELEEAVLGALLLEKEAIDRVTDILSPECFYVEQHRIIFRAIINLSAINSPVDILTVVEALKKSEELDIVGGPYNVTKLTNSVVSAANIEAHARIIYQKFIRRELIKISGQIMEEAYDDATDEFELLEESERLIQELSNGSDPGKIITLEEATIDAFQRIEELIIRDEHITGVYSGYPEIDRATRGWQPSNFILLAARPSVGKTAFALNLVRNAATHPVRSVPVAVWSLEMDVYELVLRIMAAESEVWLHRIQTGKLDPEHLVVIRKKMAELIASGKIFFDDSSNLTIPKLRVQARRLKKKYNIGMILIDYLQLISPSSKGNREQEISFISRELKKLSRELKIPVIALSQLSREVEKRKDPRPILADLRESGSLEQDADMVIFLWGPTEEEVAADASLRDTKYTRIAKHRNGVLITQEFKFRSEVQQFEVPEKDEFPQLKLLPVPQGPVKNHFETSKDDDLPF